jgi:hypothetical protein
MTLASLKGPWTYRRSFPSEGWDVWWVLTADGTDITSLPGDTPESVVAAIAAAPEMLEVLENLYDRYYSCIGNEGPEAYAAKQMINKLRGSTTYIPPAAPD